MTLSQMLTWLTQHLPRPEAHLEAELLLLRVLGKNRTYLRTYPETKLNTEQTHQLQQWLTRRCSGEPIAYILGDSEFYGLTLKVSPDVLIPRQDTELLVDTALNLIPNQTNYRILDLGTGSGAIALALATHRPQAQMTAVDISHAALAIAQDNACMYRLAHIRFVQSDWFEQITTQSFDMIVSNPPYIENHDPHLQQTSLPFEPIRALTSGDDGLTDIRQLIATSPAWLNDKGYLIIEHGYNQGQAVRLLFEQAGFYQIETHKDYGHHERITLGQWRDPCLTTP